MNPIDPFRENGESDPIGARGLRAVLAWKAGSPILTGPNRSGSAVLRGE